MGSMAEKSNSLMEQLKFGKINLLWVGSGHMVDNLIHQIDECCWLMDDWPISCHGMGGRETMEKLIEIDQGVKAIISSGNTEHPLISNYQEYGFKAAIHKPYQMQDLENVLEKVLNH